LGLTARDLLISVYLCGSSTDEIPKLKIDVIHSSTEKSDSQAILIQTPQ
jgi:hypothetical protein